MNKRNFIWNMLGSGIYALATVLFVMFAKRLIGEKAGADFYMAFTTGQMLLTIGYFEIRPFQVTDTAGQYKPGEYFAFRSITCAAMFLGGIVVGIVYMINGKADFAGFGLIMAMCVFKMTDALADVFEGEFQRNERIDISGKSMTFRTVMSLAVFCIVAYFTKNVYAASGATVVAGLIGTVVVMAVWGRRFEKITVSAKRDRMLELFKSTFLLFIASAMCMWLWNGTKYIVQWNMTDRDTLVYGIVYMPTMVINLGSSFIFKPMLTTLARHYEKGRTDKFVRLVFVLLGLVALITAVTLLAGAFLGVPVLSWLYDIDIAPYLSVMLVLIAAGGFNALGVVLYYALMVMRRQKQIFAGYLAAFVVSVVLPMIMVKNYGIMGAAESYLAVMAFLAVMFAAMTLSYCRRK